MQFKKHKYRNAFKGIVIGLFTIEEYSFYIKNSSNLNKRMMNMLIERLKKSGSVVLKLILLRNKGCKILIL
jgi:hypothetical protein